MDNLTQEQRRKNMQAIRSKGTKIEILFAKELWSRGIRYRRNSKYVLGRPDFSIKYLKIAVFCDSEFWHGKDCVEKTIRIKTNEEYWKNKIRKNIERDKYVTNELKKNGWSVFRFWSKDILTDVKKCVDKVEETIVQKSKK